MFNKVQEQLRECPEISESPGWREGIQGQSLLLLTGPTVTCTEKNTLALRLKRPSVRRGLVVVSVFTCRDLKGFRRKCQGLSNPHPKGSFYVDRCVSTSNTRRVSKTTNGTSLKDALRLPLRFHNVLTPSLLFRFTTSSIFGSMKVSDRSTRIKVRHQTTIPLTSGSLKPISTTRFVI